MNASIIDVYIKNRLNMDRTPQPGDIATLKEPYLGYRRIELLELCQYRWLVRVCDSGLEIMVHEDEFELDK